MFWSFDFWDEIAFFLRRDGQLTTEVIRILLDGQPLQVRNVEAENQNEDRANLQEKQDRSRTSPGDGNGGICHPHGFESWHFGGLFRGLDVF